jgi:hypothetical protein
VDHEKLASWIGGEFMTTKPICPFCVLEYQVGFLGGGTIFGVGACDICCARLQLAESKRDNPESSETYRMFHKRAREICRERDDEDPGVMTMTREEFEDATVRPCPNCNAPGERWRPKNAITKEEGAQHVRCSGDCLLSASWKTWQALPRKEDFEHSPDLEHAVLLRQISQDVGDIRDNLTPGQLKIRSVMVELEREIMDSLSRASEKLRNVALQPWTGE